MSDISVEALSRPGPSSIPKPKCVVCNDKDAIYACPRCTTRTCSLSCSTAHKARTGCSGVRDKAKYVAMNDYTIGTMMDDYAYLEEMGRKVGEWGRDIVKGGYTAGQDQSRGRGGPERARGRGRGGTRGRGRGPPRTKRDIMKMQLDLRDVDVDLLPTGMERRTLNQSTWDFKKQTALLTVEFKFHPPPKTAANATHTQDPPYILITHRNNSDASLLSIVQKQVRERTKTKRDGAFPPWLKALILPDPDVPDTFTLPQFFMSTPLDTPSLQAAYHKLDASQKLLSLLRHKQFIEFPTIEIWEEGAFRGIVVDAHGTARNEGVERPAKRRRLDVKKGRKMMKGLLGEYGSEEEDTDDPLAVLGEYEGSDDEPVVEGVALHGDPNGVDEEVDEKGEGGEEEVGALDYATLLDIMRHARELKGEDPDDEVDWGDSDEDVGNSLRGT